MDAEQPAGTFAGLQLLRKPEHFRRSRRLRRYQTQGNFSPQTNYNASVDWTISPTTLLNVKAARFWDNYKKLGVPNQSAIEWGEPSTGIAGLDPSLQQPKGYTTIPRTQTTLFDLATRNLIQADLSKFISLAGQQHDFKFGIGRQKNVNKVENGYPGGGYITLNWNGSLALPNGQTATRHVRLLPGG